MCREQKTGKAGSLAESTLETEGTQEARSITLLEPAKVNSAENLLDRILHRDNLNAAFKKVRQNGGAAGVDGMTVNEMLPYLKEHRERFVEDIRTGRYKPKPVRRVEIPKPDGGVRPLGVPSVLDRLVQQAVLQVLQPIFEKTFSENSYGFRPGRSAHQAINKTREYYDLGYKHVVDIDMAKYFDTVNHDILLELIGKKVKDKAVLKLLRKFMKNSVMVNGLISPVEEGVPQGSPLSPLLSNIYLNEFDRLLEDRGHKFVRYADDCNIYVKSRRAAERVMESSTRYLEGKLKLKVNREKSQTGCPRKLRFLGFSLYIRKGKARIRPHERSMKKFKDKVREVTCRKQGRPIEVILMGLKKLTTGWIGYFAIADMKTWIGTLNAWIRRRIRQIFWKQWKRISTKHKNLRRLGIKDGDAWRWANSRLGYWRVALSWILTTSLTNKYLASIGYDDISERYERMRQNY
jgi:group II intron reverse transcriptase/maturase